MARGSNIVGEASRFVFQPLKFVFNVALEGGTFVQTKDTVTGEYIADRKKTPLILRPSLYVKDPSGFLENGDKTNELSVTWKYDGSVVSSTDSTLEENVYLDGKNLVVKKNLITSMVKVEFDGKFTDVRRGDVHKFHREWNFTLQAATQKAISMSIDQPKVIHLSPFIPYDIVPINCQLFEGPSALDDEFCTYTWQYKYADETIWADVPSTPDAYTLWLSSVSSRTIKLLQAHIQSLELRCVGKVSGLSSNDAYTQYQYVNLYRYYGDVQKPVVKRTAGKIITLDTTTLGSKLFMKYSGGDIPDNDVLANFTIHWFYKYGITSTTWTMLPVYDCTEASMNISPSAMKNGSFYYDGAVMGAEVLPVTSLLPLLFDTQVLMYGDQYLVAHAEVNS